ncbi:MAG: hypothetical protein EON61_05060 [Alphaproteobacteria bacterium]|jgi:hypothetical protein|nr:MAG: hypothetical protein EON61_05060 [Alphaproteobacteria bacterium]
MTPEARFAVINSEVLLALSVFRELLVASGRQEVMRGFLLQPVPQHGTIYFSFFTADEPNFDQPPSHAHVYSHVGNPRYSSFWTGRQHSREFEAFEKWLYAEGGKPGRAEELVGQLLPMCARILKTPEVADALRAFQLSPDFEVASVDEDDGRINYCNIS